MRGKGAGRAIRRMCSRDGEKRGVFVEGVRFVHCEQYSRVEGGGGYWRGIGWGLGGDWLVPSTILIGSTFDRLSMKEEGRYG